MTPLVYVTAADCHLCEHGRAVLDELGVERREVAADSDEAALLTARGVPLSFLPVLLDGTRTVAYGRLSARRLRRELGL